MEPLCSDQVPSMVLPSGESVPVNEAPAPTQPTAGTRMAIVVPVKVHVPVLPTLPLKLVFWKIWYCCMKLSTDNDLADASIEASSSGPGYFSMKPPPAGKTKIT